MEVKLDFAMVLLVVQGLLVSFKNFLDLAAHMYSPLSIHPDRVLRLCQETAQAHGPVPGMAGGLQIAPSTFLLRVMRQLKPKSVPLHHQ
jgi:hypothetical protein